MTATTPRSHHGTGRLAGSGGGAGLAGGRFFSSSFAFGFRFGFGFAFLRSGVDAIAALGLEAAAGFRFLFDFFVRRFFAIGPPAL